MKSLNDKHQRDTILVMKAHEFLGEICKNEKVGRIVNRFSRWIDSKHKSWGIGHTGTLKRIERFLYSKNSSLPQDFDLRAVAYHYGAVPALTIGEILRGSRRVFVTVLPQLSDLPISNSVEYKTELLLSFSRHLPHLLKAYYEQIGFYLTSIFFGADDTHVIKYAHRIRSIAKGSIRSKIEEMEADQKAATNRLLASRLRTTFEQEIKIAQAVDAFAHLATNYIYSFFCMQSDVAKYEKRLYEIVYSEDVLGEEHPISFLRECAKHISEPESSDLFLARIDALKLKPGSKWLIPFGEAAVFIGEIRRSCHKGFAAPTVFVGFHFGIEGNDRAYKQLELAINDHWKHVQLLKGRKLARNIRWSLLGRVWFADAYLFLIPPTFITTEGVKKPLDPKEDWLLLEFVYTVLIRKYCLTMKPKAFDQKVFDELQRHLANYAPEHEIIQIKKSHWEAHVAKAKRHWHQIMRDVNRLPSMDILEVDSLASFEQAILNPLHQNLIELFFRAAYWYLDPGGLLALQVLLKKLPTGRGTIKRTELRSAFKSLRSKYEFSDGINNLLEFNFDLFDKLEPIATENEERVITLRLADVVELLCKKFCCHQSRIIEDVIHQMLSPRSGDR